jgi:hypothetical protein
MSKINLSEKLELTSQIYHLLFGNNDTQKRLFLNLHSSNDDLDASLCAPRSDEKPFIGEYEEEAWIKDMQNLDMEFLNTSCI